MFDQPPFLPVRPTKVIRFIPSDPHAPISVDMPDFDDMLLNIIELPT